MCVWLAVSVVQGFRKSKELCYRRMQYPRSFALVWPHELLREQAALFGKDPWPYNLEENRKMLELTKRLGFKREGGRSGEADIRVVKLTSSL